MYMCPWLLSHVRLLAALWTVAYQAPLSMGFSRREYWRGLPFPSPEDRPKSPALQAYSLLLSHQKSPIFTEGQIVPD